LREQAHPDAHDAGEVVLALPCAEARVPLATHIRGTVLASSLAAIESMGLRDAYFDALPKPRHDAMRSIVVGEWQPMDLGVAHYGAIEALGLSFEQARENGVRVADRVQKSYLATMIRALGFGITPWSILPRTQSILDRLLQRVAAAVLRVGPKDARIEIHGAPIASFQYVRGGWAGMIEGGLDLVTRKTYCRDVSRPNATTVAAFLVSWA
jgi:hypothetical protein